MRLAIVAASSYEANGQVAPIPNAEIDVELFGRRLAEPDAGFTVHAFDAERGLPEGIEALATGLGGRVTSLVFYFWGYALLSEERGPALLLDGPKLAPFTVARLRRLLTEVADESLVVIDATLAAGSAGEPLDVVRTMGMALSGRESTVSSLISVRPQQRRILPGPPPFTGLVQMILDTQSGSPSALTPETLFRAMQAEEVMFADIPAAGCFLAQNEFVVVPGVGGSQGRHRDLDEVTSRRSLPPPTPPPPRALVPHDLGAPPPPPPPARTSAVPLPPLSARPPPIPGAPPPARISAPPPPALGSVPPLGSALPPMPIRPPSITAPPLLPRAFVPPPPPRATLPSPPPIVVPPPPPRSAFPTPPTTPISYPPPAPSPDSFSPSPLPGSFPAPPALVSPPPPRPPLVTPHVPIGAQALLAPGSPPPPPPPLPPPPAVEPPEPPTMVRASIAPPSPRTPPSSVRPPRNDGAHSPDDPEGYRFLLRHFERKGDADAVYRAALCLEALGEADINESMLVSTYRPDGLQSVRGTLSYADWNERLCSGIAQPDTTALLRSIAPALSSVGYQHVRRQRRDRDLPEEARQDLEKSTTTLAKTLLWASRLLCVPATELYVLPELSGSLGLSPGAERPELVCSRALGSGFGLAELVFLWSRELSFARHEQAALCYFSDANEMSQLLLAALALGGATSMRAIDGDAKRIASALKREVRGGALDSLQTAAARMSPLEVGRSATEFMREAELVAGRVGLVACGRLDVALALGERFPRGVVTNAYERRADLLRFTTSSDFGQIRAALGVAVG